MIYYDLYENLHLHANSRNAIPNYTSKICTLYGDYNNYNNKSIVYFLYLVSNKIKKNCLAMNYQISICFERFQ